MDQYSNLTVRGNIKQKGAQGTANDDVVLYPTLTTRVPAQLPTPDDPGKAIVVNSNGDGFVLGEAGKVDEIYVNGGPNIVGTDPSDTSTYKKADIPAATTSAFGVVEVGTNINVNSGVISVNTATTDQKGVMQVGSTLEVSSGTVNQKSGVNSTTTAQGSASKTVTVTADTYGRVTDISQQDISIAASQVSSGTLASARLPDATSSSKGAVTLVYATGESDVINVPTEGKMEEFVNSSVGTNTAYFKGTYDVETDLGLAETATQAQVITALNAKTSWKVGGAPTNNDYCFVQFDLSQDPGNVDRYDRYKYSTESTPATWVYEYTLNNSSFTSEQWAAINSKISNSTVGTESVRSVDVRYIVTGPASATVDHIATFNSADGNVVKDSGFTIATSVPSGAVFTDEHVTSSANHYSPSTASGQDKTASASGGTAAWSIDVVQGVTLNTDGKGHVTGISVASGKIPANPNTDAKVQQKGITTNAEYPILLKYDTGTTDVAANYVNFAKPSSMVPTINASTGAITAAGGFIGNASTATNVAYTGITNNPFSATDVTLADM